MSTWIPLLVRSEDYFEIATLVADREASRTDEPSEVSGFNAMLPPRTPPDGDDAELGRRVPWSIEDLTALSRGTSETAKRWTLAMDACCEVAGQWLSTSKIVDRTGMSINDWRDAPRKLRRHLIANFPNVPIDDSTGDHIWPLLGKSKAGSHEIHWAMNDEQAKRWRQVRGL